MERNGSEPRYCVLWQDAEGAWHTIAMSLTEGEAQATFDDWDPPAGRMVRLVLMSMEALQVKPAAALPGTEA